MMLNEFQDATIGVTTMILKTGRKSTKTFAVQEAEKSIIKRLDIEDQVQQRRGDLVSK